MSICTSICKIMRQYNMFLIRSFARKYGLLAGSNQYGMFGAYLKRADGTTEIIAQESMKSRGEPDGHIIYMGDKIDVDVFKRMIETSIDHKGRFVPQTFAT